ncbi:MAG: xanthine dehydrogenase family protein molybdopterin-binding subunit [Burkholderiales bacterium]
MSWIGRSIRRFEDPTLLVGQGQFVGDIAGDALAVRFVRSAIAKGRIRRIDVPPGASVFTAADLVGVKPICPILHRPDYVRIGQPALARDRVTHVGEPIAVVVADDPAHAEDLAENVVVDIDPEDPVIDVDAALLSSAPTVHPEAPGNVIVEGAMRTPGFDAAFARATRIVDIDVRSRRQSAMPMEPRGGHASYDPTTRRITLFASVQMPHMLRTALADVLGMPESDLRVIAPDVGGGFGQKMAFFPEYIVLVWLARHLKRAVVWIEDRQENLLASAHARDQHYLVRGAFDADAKLLAYEADMRCNIGAYSCYPTTCGVEPLMALAEFPGPYDFRECSVRARGVVTNTAMMVPYRGVSRPVLTLAMERLMDTAAARFGIDPLEIRRRNLITKFPYQSVTGISFDEGSYRVAMERAAETIDVAAFRVRQKIERGRGRYLGLGFSVFSERSGYGTSAFAARKMEIVPGYETVEIAMDPGGFVEVRIGSSPHGQGLGTTLAQIVADEIGLAPDRIRIIHGDTDNTPYGWGTFASRSLVIAGGACKLAGERLALRMRKVAAVLMEASAEDIELAEGKARIQGTDRSIDVATLARAAYHQSHRLGADIGPGLRDSATYDPGGTFSNACHVAIVEVDLHTGGVRIERFLAVEDAGILINPMIVDGQVHGGITQGIANALYEELKYDESGNLLTTTLADYLPPTMHEVPTIEIQHLQTTTDASVTGAKGVGEGGAIGAPAAVVNAIVDALAPFGIEFFEMPVTPERIRAALRGAQKGAA